ncbi:hypothetical protein JL720_3305 [Aureococcus anophagefferens]|nr:hypothetical protein JL720_3305 [Aureococcus anophagefferens]
MSSLSLSVVRALDEHSLLLLYGGGEGSGTASVYCGNEWTVRAVFGMLPPVEQQIVLRLATCGAGGCALGLARRWVAADRGDVFAEAVATLEALRCVELGGAAGAGAERRLCLAPAFLRNLRRALGGATAEPWRAREPLKADKRKPTESAGLMAAVGGGGDVEVTGRGVDFLLKERHEQVWALVDEYIRAAGDAKGEVVALVLTLAYATPGEGYAIHELGGAEGRARRPLRARPRLPAQRELVALLPDDAGRRRRLRGGGRGGGRRDFRRPVDVIVQTNFQVLAYTDAGVNTSTLVLATLNLFAELTTRLPNLVVGTISRDAIKRCVDRGIRVPQIVKFVRAHAHPAMKASGVPQNVTDQMALWAGEGNRVAFTDGVLVALDSDALYDAALDAARDLDARVHWKSARKRCLFVDADAEPDLRRRLAAAAAPRKRKAPDN